MKVKGFLKDVGGASRVTKMRQQLIANGSPLPDPKDPIRELADLLHPGKQQFTVTGIREASPTATTYRFSPVNGHVPVFQSGQYVNFYLTVGESVLTRAYSISSAPYEARLAEPYFEVTIRHNVHYLVPDWFQQNVKVGTEITAALPFGQFLYEPLRDSDHIVGIGRTVVVAGPVGAIVDASLERGLDAEKRIVGRGDENRRCGSECNHQFFHLFVLLV